MLLSVIVFAAAQLLPGNVGRNVLGPFASEQDVAQYNHEHGLDKPVSTQYWDWVSHFVARRPGTSLQYNVSVRDLLGPSLGNSLKLAAFAFVFVVPLEHPRRHDCRAPPKPAHRPGDHDRGPLPDLDPDS